MSKITKGKKTKVSTDSKKQKVNDITDVLESILAVKRVFKSKDGEQFITLLRNNCADSLRKLIVTAREKPELNSLLSIIFDYSANMDLLLTLGDIKLEEELREQLDEAIREATE